MTKQAWKWGKELEYPWTLLASDGDMSAEGMADNNTAIGIPQELLPLVGDFLRCQLEVELHAVQQSAKDFTFDGAVFDKIYGNHVAAYQALKLKKVFDSKYDLRTSWKIVETEPLFGGRYGRFEWHEPVKPQPPKSKKITQKAAASYLAERWGQPISARKIKVVDNWIFYKERASSDVACIEIVGGDIYSEVTDIINVEGTPFGSDARAIKKTIEHLNRVSASLRNTLTFSTVRVRSGYFVER